MSGLPQSVKSFSIPRNKLLVNVDYTTLGNNFAVAFIQIHIIHQLEKLQKKKLRLPEFPFQHDFHFFLRNMEIMKRITIMTIMREMIIILICLQISLISKRYSRRLSRKQILESYIWKVEFPLRRSQIYYQPKSKVRNQNLSKTTDDVF